jgi:hypothetical protein
MARRGGRVIDTGTLRISPMVKVSSDGQAREQDSEDNPNVNASEQTSRYDAVKQLGVAAVYTQHFQRTYVASDRRSSMGSRCVSLPMTPHLRRKDY